MVVVVGLATMDITRVKNPWIPAVIATLESWDGYACEGTKVKAVHTNATATRLGAIGSWAAPRGTDPLWHTAIAGTTGGASIVVTATTQRAINVWHTQVTRTLSVTADPGSIRRGGRVTFTVADAGDPVAGARVRFGSRQGTTNGAGKVTLAAPGSGGRVQVTASKGTYNDGSASVRVR